jgi:hypothetical protein
LMKIWHILVLYFGLRFLVLFAKWVHYKYKQVLNSRIAKKLLSDRNSKQFKFESIDQSLQDLLIEADVHTIRDKLMDGTVTSVQLVNFFGQRSH